MFFVHVCLFQMNPQHDFGNIENFLFLQVLVVHFLGHLHQHTNNSVTSPHGGQTSVLIESALKFANVGFDWWALIVSCKDTYYSQAPACA